MPKVAEKVILSSLVLLLCGLIALIVVVARQANTIAANELYSLKTYDDKWVDIYNYNAPSVVVVQYFPENEDVKVGTGFFLTEDGYICTCAHAVMDASSNVSSTIIVTVNITDSSGATSHNNYNATLVGFDGHGDVAILKIDPGNYSTPPVTLVTDITENLVAYDVMVIGCIFGIDYESCAMGNVRDQKWTDPTGRHQLSCLLTSVPTSAGNSGSPIFDVMGRCLGMHQNSFQPGPTNNWSIQNESSLTSEPVNGGLDSMARLMEETPVDGVQEVNMDDTVMPKDAGSDTSTELTPMDKIESSKATVEATGDLFEKSMAEKDTTGAPGAADPSSTTEQGSIGSTFGGGITAKNLHAIAFAIIDKHQNKDSPQVEKLEDGTLKYNQKGWIGFFFRTNTPLNYINFQQYVLGNLRKDAISKLKTAYKGGGLIVEAIYDPAVAKDLKPGNVIIAIDGVPVGPFGYQSSPGDITYSKTPGQTVKLTVEVDGVINTITVGLVPYPALLDRPYGELQSNIFTELGKIVKSLIPKIPKKRITPNAIQYGQEVRIQNHDTSKFLVIRQNSKKRPECQGDPFCALTSGDIPDATSIWRIIKADPKDPNDEVEYDTNVHIESFSEPGYYLDSREAYSEDAYAYNVSCKKSAKGNSGTWKIKKDKPKNPNNPNNPESTTTVVTSEFLSRIENLENKQCLVPNDSWGGYVITWKYNDRIPYQKWILRPITTFLPIPSTRNDYIDPLWTLITQMNSGKFTSKDLGLETVGNIVISHAWYFKEELEINNQIFRCVLYFYPKSNTWLRSYKAGTFLWNNGKNKFESVAVTDITSCAGVDPQACVQAVLDKNKLSPRTLLKFI
jgi:S1-C subfamily serine protease